MAKKYAVLRTASCNTWQSNIAIPFVGLMIVALGAVFGAVSVVELLNECMLLCLCCARAGCGLALSPAGLLAANAHGIEACTMMFHVLSVMLLGLCRHGCRVKCVECNSSQYLATAGTMLRLLLHCLP